VRWALCLALCAAGAGAGAGAQRPQAGQEPRTAQAPQAPDGHVLSLPPQAREFSAEIVSRDVAGSQVGAVAKIYVSNRKVRIETPQASNGFFLLDAEAGTAVFVLPAQRVFMDAKQSSRLTQLFVPIDSPDACGPWQAAANDARKPGVASDWRCERMQDGIIDGRRAAEYRVAAPENASSLRWVDCGLGFPVKVMTADGATVALEHIRSEAQPAELFAVPAGFRNFDPRALLERIKHSDVWVEP
jgi:hypothetical protein